MAKCIWKLQEQEDAAAGLKVMPGQGIRVAGAGVSHLPVGSGAAPSTQAANGILQR